MPHEEIAPFTVKGDFHQQLETGKIRCEICPRYCTLQEGQRAFCFVRQVQNGEVVLTSYGRSTGFCIDPIEKKPLNHFFPGSAVLSFGTAGCNLGCKFCQNWDISKAREVERLSERAMPEDIASAARNAGCTSVAFTYNDPVIFMEYAVDTAQACREQNIKSVAVSAGYISKEARPQFFEYIDAANIDLKAFTENFYHKLAYGHLQPVLDTLLYLKHETSVWFEITNLIIPEENDSDEELKSLSDWLVENLGPDVPLHFSAFHPDFKMLEHERTPAQTLHRAREIARSAGLNYVYTGNIHDSDGGSTYCSKCNALLIERDWYALGKWNLNKNQCKSCATTLAGHFQEKPGNWGRKRQPLAIMPP